ncbi:hypothetical protein [Loktanella sp. 3ANDIMAR09]|uniref:hypothetical protein n=1 Tax=Loktanella sp. 3ANDIMAR09 TaxID=1225657 RepID=UPI000A6AE054|nr:hypothetical protein [Loktanella sp. 3ANDIMAR09]
MNFLNDENGAVTVDWVVLAAAMVLLPIAAAMAVAGGAGDLTTEIASSLEVTE